MSLPPSKWLPSVLLIVFAASPAVVRRWFPPLPLFLAAIVSGVLLALAFPPVSMGLLSLVALVPLVVTLYRAPYPRRDFFRAGYLFGVSFFLADLWWIVRLVPASSITLPWLMTPALIALVAYLAVYPALFFLLLRLIGGDDRRVIWLLGPAIWALLEWIRSSGDLGFPWAAIGYALVRYPVLIQWASVVGITGIGALVILVNVIVSLALLERSAGAKTVWLAVGIGLLALTGLHGKREIERYANTIPEDTSRVAIVQPNVDLALKWKPEFTDSTFRLIERFSRQAAMLAPDLIVFPETAAPVYLRHNLPYRQRIEALAEEIGVGVFIGFLDGRYDGPRRSLNVYNSSGLFYPDGAFAPYDKMHLLPFGEAIPFAWKFRKLQPIDFGQANFHPGPEVKPIRSGAGHLGPLICFEAIFPGLSRRFVKHGADVIVNITNDGWFGDTPGPYQHNDMAIFRAVENRRFLVRSANTGISMVVDPVGRVTNALGLFEEGVLVVSVYRVTTKTFYTRHGDLPVVVGLVLAILAGGIVSWYRRRVPWPGSIA
ncbi:MAG: apolipoprotein N-acyltransferase [Candidatus Latescibacterota bacterium]|nr:MAG: apolipoprotein N-acyltransferase [Candidatus Latescibacterota bacterium]